jgi:hypothetical protein
MAFSFVVCVCIRLLCKSHEYKVFQNVIDRVIDNTTCIFSDSRMTQITANDLKTRGIAAIEASLADGRLEAMVSVRGADRFVVMGMAHYQHLRECELEAALAESRADIAAGRFVVESPAEHVKRVTAKVAAEGSVTAARAVEPAAKSLKSRARRSTKKSTAKSSPSSTPKPTAKRRSR